MFADIHSHVLCGIDDGAKNLEETRELLTQLTLGGVTHLALTPHYYPYERSVVSFLEKRQAAYESLLTLPEAKPFTLTLGAEVYLTETLMNNSDLSPLCYKGTRYILTELEYTESFTAATRRRLLHLTEDHGLVPVLAHIDRYPFFRRNPRHLAWLESIGCLFQVNLSAFAGPFSQRRMIRLYDQGWLHFVGEDVHHTVMPPQKKNKVFSRLKQKRPDLLEKANERAVKCFFEA